MTIYPLDRNNRRTRRPKAGLRKINPASFQPFVVHNLSFICCNCYSIISTTFACLNVWNVASLSRFSPLQSRQCAHTRACACVWPLTRPHLRNYRIRGGGIPAGYSGESCSNYHAITALRSMTPPSNVTGFKNRHFLSPKREDVSVSAWKRRIKTRISPKWKHGPARVHASF